MFDQVDGYELRAGQELSYRFQLPEVNPGQRVGFGGWFAITEGVDVSLESAPQEHVLLSTLLPNWGKFGSQWVSPTVQNNPIDLRFRACKLSRVAVWKPECGVVQHEFLDDARDALLQNMWRFAPEGNFYKFSALGNVEVHDSELPICSIDSIARKSCNRCGRFLPVNIADERTALSFSNHCIAPHRRPCRHVGFGRIEDITNGGQYQLQYGFQLECRFCKKFTVNAPHNPQRNRAQMKEDGARRRAFELLLDHLYCGSPLLRYRPRTGSELADDIWDRFDGKCFKCGTAFTEREEMQLDHTRPLALLWPLDESATSLCATHNSEKRDRPPVEFYTEEELERLAVLTGIPLDELMDPSPNREAIQLLTKNLEWFFDDFLKQDYLSKTRDGKNTADLLVKALQRAINFLPDRSGIDLMGVWGKYQIDN